VHCGEKGSPRSAGKRVERKEKKKGRFEVSTFVVYEKGGRGKAKRLGKEAEKKVPVFVLDRP